MIRDSATRIPFSEAKRRSRANAEARLPKRGEPNQRLEPECWPALRPTFSFDRDSSIFVIGSCFATNVERYLSERGYKLDSLAEAQAGGLGPGSLNKYTPASIYEEIKWARDIYDRDDRMTAADVERCLFRLPDGRVIDTQLHAQEPETEESARAKREIVYRTYRALFKADVVIITLGLVEAWYDTVLQRYICETPSRPMLRVEDRFQFEQLDYATSLDFLTKSHELICRSNKPNILVTTSPVILSRTFTSDDVLVANMYSKSVLRAVAGRFTAMHNHVDYFPSYESVMLTRNNAVWRDDLVHVAPPFIKQIMMRVEQAYTGNLSDDQMSATDAVSRFVGLIGAHSYDEAEAQYAAFADPYAVASPEFQTAAALLWMHRQDRARAKAHLDAEVGLDRSFTNLYAVTRVAVAEWLDGVAGRDRAIELLKLRKEFGTSHVWKAAQWHAADGHIERSLLLLRMLDPEAVKLSGVRNQVRRMLERAGDEATARRFVGE